MSVSDDTILEQVEFVYDAAGNVIQTVTRQRYHNASTGQTGPLQNPSTTPKARVTYTASWPDALGRTQASANYGTNGGAAFTRPGTIPSRSDNVLVSSTDYDAAGNVLQSTDPSGMVTRFAYDDAGRETERVMNYQADPPPPESSSSSACSCSSGTTCGECGPSDDVNVTVETAYNADGNVSSITAKNASTGDQVTQYVYGTTLEDSDIASSLLKRQEIYPDSVDEDDVIEFSYNRQQQVKEVTDQAGTVHAFDFDKLGRQIHDRVTTLGSGVDGAVRRISTEYEARGMRSKVTSWNNASVTSGDVVNQCQYAYNNFGQLTTEWQSHSGTVNTSTTPKVEYGYADGSANTIRPETLTYPDGRVITSDYGAADSMADALSRVASLIDDDDTHLTDYSYLGLSSFVVDDYTEPDLKWTLADLSGTNDPDTGDIYSGLDRFGRVKDNRWYDSGNSVDADRIKYGYDRAGNRIWRNNTVAASLSKAFDELYSYDGVHRLKDMQRGTLNGGRTAIANGTATFGECWTLDSTGNWNNYRQDDDGNGCWDLDQTRTTNAVNEITNLSETAGPAWVTPAYSRAGNMTTIPKPADPTESFTATYDAWNRLVKLEEDNGSGGLWSVAEYAYDGAKRRTVVKSYTSGTLSETRHAYFTASWQNLEERLGTNPSSADPDRQFVWGLRYIDDLILRDRDTDSNGALDERLYALQDANWNVTSIADPSATIQERYAYAAYGTPLFLDVSFNATGSSSYQWETLYAGYCWDRTTRQFYVRNRKFSVHLGLWLQRDPVGLAAGINLYDYVSANTLARIDPLGLWLIACGIITECDSRLVHNAGYWFIRKLMVQIRREREKCEKRIAPTVIQMAVEKALVELGCLGTVNVDVGSADKANISTAEWGDLQACVGAGAITNCTTISGDAAWCIALPSGWELKIYSDASSPGQLQVVVGHATGSSEHDADAIRWMLGQHPNGRNAEDYLGMYATDDIAAKQLANACAKPCCKDLCKPYIGRTHLILSHVLP